MWERYQRYLTEPPQIVVEWSDGPTDAQGWLVINSLRGGAAGGGTRMHPHVTREEVTYLAKAMELKFSFSGPPIGGAKSGIAFDPKDPRRREVLTRWFQKILPYLETCYGTAGDVNVDEQRDVVPICTALGLVHHQQGILLGHHQAEGARRDEIVATVQAGLKQSVSDPAFGVPGRDLCVSDVITGYGVMHAAKSLFRERGRSLAGARVIIEGFGNVGRSAAFFLSRAGAILVGLVDQEYALAAPEGLDSDALEDLVMRSEGRRIPEHPARLQGADRQEAYNVDADIFVPAAISGSVDASRLQELSAHGVSAIVCGANQPFRETSLGATVTLEAADEMFDIIPDSIASMGMARSFAHLMESAPDSSQERIFAAVSEGVDSAVKRVLENSSGQSAGLVRAAIDLALANREAEAATATATETQK